jgi:hypothetical protein
VVGVEDRRVAGQALRRAHRLLDEREAAQARRGGGDAGLPARDERPQRVVVGGLGAVVPADEHAAVGREVRRVARRGDADDVDPPSADLHGGRRVGRRRVDRELGLRVALHEHPAPEGVGQRRDGGRRPRRPGALDEQRVARGDQPLDERGIGEELCQREGPQVHGARP